MNLVFDIDNTIYYRNDKEISEIILNKLKYLGKKHKLYFATRREIYNLNPIEELIKLNLVANVICGNGAYDMNHEYETSFMHEPNDFINFLLEKKFHFMIETYAGIKVFNKGRLYQLEHFYNNKIIANSEDYEDVVSILINCKKSDEIENFCCNYQFNYVYSDYYQNYCISNENTNKKRLVSKLCGNDYIAFGDNIIDDLDMINEAEIGYFITNELSCNELKINKYELVELLDQLM